MSEQNTNDRQEWIAPYVIDRSHPNQAYVTYGFSDEAECTQFIKATRYGSHPDQQGVALSEQLQTAYDKVSVYPEDRMAPDAVQGDWRCLTICL